MVLGDELRGEGSGSIVLVTGFGLKVTLRALLGRAVSCRKRGVRSVDVPAELVDGLGEVSIMKSRYNSAQ